MTVQEREPSPLVEYRKLRDEADKLRHECDALGRTDVPYDDERHLRFASAHAQQSWLAAQCRLWDVEARREKAWRACCDFIGRDTAMGRAAPDAAEAQ